MSQINREVGLEYLGSVIEERLNHNQHVRMTVVGNSMYPLFRSKLDSVVLEPVKNKIKKGDVVLYKRESGQYVLHRIVKRKGDVFTANGDNQYWLETPLYAKQFLGKMIGFYRKNKYYEITTWWYRLYAVIWVLFRPLRGIMIRFLLNFAKLYQTKVKKREK